MTVTPRSQEKTGETYHPHDFLNSAMRETADLEPDSGVCSRNTDMFHGVIADVRNDVLKAASTYLSRSWFVLPAHPKGKYPLVKYKYRNTQLPTPQ
jgi:hypothetical protein